MIFEKYPENVMTDIVSCVRYSAEIVVTTAIRMEHLMIPRVIDRERRYVFFS